jgi:hypothetical protein
MPVHHPSSLYETQSQGRYCVPFNLKVDPMERLLLVDFTRDPDPLYHTFEIQVFDDLQHGKGMLVLAAQGNKKIDIYHQPGLDLTNTDYGIVGKGLDEMLERSMEGARYAISPYGVDVKVEFDDKLGRPVKIRIYEKGLKPRNPFNMLAPLGHSTEDPPSLPLVLLYDFYFVRRAGTEIDVLIDGVSHRPDNLPFPIDGSRVHFLRYSADPFVLNWNEKQDGLLLWLQIEKPGMHTCQGAVYNLVDNHGHLELSGMRPAHSVRDVRFVFDPPFPDLVRLREGAEGEGAFTLWMEEIGTLEGIYTFQRQATQALVEVIPSGGWRPRVNHRSAKIIFALARNFRDWPKTYHWSAVVDLNDIEAPTMKSGWRREMR